MDRPRITTETIADPLPSKKHWSFPSTLWQLSSWMKWELGMWYDLAKKMGITTLVEEGRYNDLGLAPLALGGLTHG